jgi:hypothetical protein
VTLSRRAFTFASLAATFGAKLAHAEAPQAQAPNAPPPTIPEVDEPVAAEPAQSQFAASATLVPVGRGQVELSLQIKNKGGKTSVLVARGSRPAADPVVVVNVNGAPVELTRVQTEVDRREFMSRMGPVPRFADVKANETFALGPWRFALPEGAVAPATVRFSLLAGKDGDQPMSDVAVRVANVGWGQPAS